MENEKNQTVRIKPCGCIVKEGGIVILCHSHAKVELRVDSELKKYSPVYRNIQECIKKFLDAGVFSGSDAVSVIAEALDVVNLILAEKREGETIKETTIRLIEQSRKLENMQKMKHSMVREVSLPL